MYEENNESLNYRKITSSKGTIQTLHLQRLDSATYYFYDLKQVA